MFLRTLAQEVLNPILYDIHKRNTNPKPQHETLTLSLTVLPRMPYLIGYHAYPEMYFNMLGVCHSYPNPSFNPMLS